MKSLLGFALLLLLISGLGYFALLNNHNVAVHLYGSFTLQFAVWTMILGCFALGFLLSESRFLFSSPQSWINRLRKIWKNRGERQRLGRQDHFRKALLEGNYAEMEKNFRLLEKDPEALIQLKIQHLEQLRFFESKEEVFRRYDEAISDQPNQLELELSFFRMLLWQKDWSGLEELSTKMKKKFPDHPEVLEGLSRMMEQKQNWKQCVELERRLLEEFPKKFGESFFLDKHIDHLKKAFQHDPEDFQDWDFSYLKPFLPEIQVHTLQTIGKIELQRSREEYEKASVLCTKLFLENGETEILHLWEELFLESNKSSIVLDSLKQTQSSKKINPYISLMLAKAHYLRMEYEKASVVLSRLKWPDGNTPELQHALNLLIARHEKREQEMPYLLSEWLPEKRLLDIPLENMKFFESSPLLEMNPNT